MVAVPDEVYERLRATEDSSLRNELGLKAHEDRCALRYEALWSEVKSTNRTLRWAGTSLLAGMAAILAKLVFFP